jgi:hypothetical protein
LGVVSEPGPGLTHDSADAVEVVLLPACRPGPVPGTRQWCRSDLPGPGKRPGFRVRRPAGACHPSTRKGTASDHRRRHARRPRRHGRHHRKRGRSPCRARHHRRRRHPRGHPRRGRARPGRRAPGDPGVPGHRARVRGPAGLAARFRDRHPGRRRRRRQLRGGPGQRESSQRVAEPDPFLGGVDPRRREHRHDAERGRNSDGPAAAGISAALSRPLGHRWSRARKSGFL